MQYCLPANETPAAGTRVSLQQLLDRIAALLADVQPLSDSDVHEIRKTCKRLRALLRMVQPRLSPDEFRKADRKIRDLAAQLATLRDNRILVETLDKIAQHFDPLLNETALAPVRESLQALHASTSRMAAASASRRSLQKRLKRLRGILDNIDLEGISRKTIISGMTASYRRGRRAYAALEAVPDTANAHTLRRHAKHLYYLLQFTADWNDAALAPLVGKFHRLEDELGNDHDIAVLVETLTKQPQLCPDKTRRELLSALAESRRIALLSSALRLAGELYRDRPRKYRNWLEATLSRPA